MNRRKFIEISGTGIAFSLASAPFISCSEVSGSMTAAGLNDYLRSIVEVEEPSVDRVIIGKPDTRITKIGTAWTPYWDTLKKAWEAGVNVMVVHEPTFFTHWDLDAEKWDYLDAPDPARKNYIQLRDEKKKWIEDNGMVIIRCHDVLDKISEWGIPYALGEGLGFTNDDIIRSKTYYNVYKIPATPAIEVARRIARQLGRVDQPGVAFYGDENYPVESIGLGTGCISDPLNYSELDPDLFISIDDTIRTWIQTTYAMDSGQPLVVINHGTSEEFGVRALSDHLQEHIRDHEVIHFNQGCSYQWVTV